MFLDTLPVKEGMGVHKGRMLIDWIKSVGYKVKFIYNNIEGYLEIVDKQGNYLFIKYLDNDIYKMHTTTFAECGLGKLLGVYTSNFKYEIGQVLENEKINITITNREYRETKSNDKIIRHKYYEYRCNKCGVIAWNTESHIKAGRGCLCNNIIIEAPWMIPYFQGGIEEAKLYTYYSEKRIIPICPICGRVKEKSMMVGTLYQSHSIGCTCGDGHSYPEKIMFNVLEQLKVDFINQLTKTKFEWCNGFRYDFYIPSLNIIIETHGMQHYKKTNKYFLRSLEEEQANDECKKQLALKNEIKEDNYIVIDCRYSKLDNIKQNILNSKLSELFDLNKVDWNKAHNFALCSRVTECCDLWNNKTNNIKEIANIMKLNRITIKSYLKKGGIV